MSKSNRINKSQAVRDALAESATGSPSEIVKMLAEQGIEVSAAFVSNIKSQEKKKNRLSAVESGVDLESLVKLVGTDQVPIGSKELESASRLILEAVDLVVHAGPQQARELIAVAEKLIATIHQIRGKG